MNLLPLGSQAYQHLLKEILAGKRLEGERISEESTAMEFGISRTPAREALMRLSADGLVERTARKGCRVRRVSTEATAISEERLAIIRAILAGDRNLAESRLSAHIFQGINPHKFAA